MAITGIYKITNNINGKSYIGQSIDIENRWKQEKSRAFSLQASAYNNILSQAFRKYGIENFTFEIVETCKPEELNEKEIYYISKFNTYYEGYNATTGGGNGNQNNEIKISKEQLLEIYDLLINSTISQGDIAKKYNVGQDTISYINQGKSRVLSGYSYPLRNNKREKKYCCDCGKEINKNSLRCDSCQKITLRVTQRPSREELKKLIRTTSFTQIGKQFGVSDNSIRKWCDAYNLPRRVKDINTYSQEEWEQL